jgi:SH3-like domain-containing protein
MAAIQYLTGSFVPATASVMRFRVVHCATRLLMAVALVMAAGKAGAVAPVDQSSPDGPHPHPKPRAAQESASPVPRSGRTEAHKAVERRGKTKTEKAQAEGGKGSGGAPKAGDQRGHAVAPVAVAPPAPKPVVAPPVKDSGEPPPKLPRFAALKTDDTNMRKGPGQRYPIEWVYQRHDLPMEVEREYDVWRYVKDPDGVEGWVHQVTLSDRRTFMVVDKEAALRADANDTSGVVAMLKSGVIGRLRECAEGSKWCQVQVGGYRGYLRRDQIWGLLPDEVLGPS